jgi:hypothetical protein
MNTRAWLSEIPWDMAVWQNQQLCKPKNTHHGPTSDRHEPCRALWEQSQPLQMTLAEMVDLCRKCHRLAPFTNYNGNTFSAIARALIETLPLPPATLAVARSLAHHIVAGVASHEEVQAFRKFCEETTHP